MLTFFGTYRRFRDVFAGAVAVTKRDVNGVRVEVVQYVEADDNGIVALDAGSGTVAVWQIGERGFALIDQGDHHLQDGIYDGVLGSFLILGTTWSQPLPVEGYYAPDRHMAFDLPGLPVTILLPAGYGVATNTEYLRRGSLVSFDFLISHPTVGNCPAWPRSSSFPRLRSRPLRNAARVISALRETTQTRRDTTPNSQL